jgi:hypothetical protein
MVEEKMLVKSTNKVGTEIFYLGHFAMQTLQRVKLPDKDVRQNQFLESITIRSDNGFRVINKRQKIQQEHPPATSDKSRQHQKRVVPHHRQRRRLEPARNQPYPAPTKNYPKTH